MLLTAYKSNIQDQNKTLPALEKPTYVPPSWRNLHPCSKIIAPQFFFLNLKKLW